MTASTTAPALTNQGIDALYRYGVGETVHDVATFLGTSPDLTRAWLNETCDGNRDRAYQLALTTRSRP